MVNESAAISNIKTIWQSQLFTSIRRMVVRKKQHGGKSSSKLNTLILNKIEQIIEENPCITLKRIHDKILESEHVEPL